MTMCASRYPPGSPFAKDIGGINDACVASSRQPTPRELNLGDAAARWEHGDESSRGSKLRDFTSFEHVEPVSDPGPGFDPPTLRHPSHPLSLAGQGPAAVVVEPAGDPPAATC